MTAISLEKLSRSVILQDFRMGEPNRVNLYYHQVDTRRIEISYVSEEKKSNEIPEVVTSEMGSV